VALRPRRMVSLPTAALIVLATIAGLAGAGLVSPAAQARPQETCCFRITVEVTGQAEAQYRRVDPTDDQGNYDYEWDGTAYGLAHLQGSGLVTDRAVAAGYLKEQNAVTDGEGRPRDRNDPGCSQGDAKLSGQATFEKTRHGSPFITLGPHGGLAFDRPFEHWELDCGSLATDTLIKLQEGNADWFAPREFFSNSRISGLSARKLAKGRSQKVTCVEKSRPNVEPRLFALGFSGVSINIVPFPADDLKHQQHRLAGFLGKTPDFAVRRPIVSLEEDFWLGKKGPGNGCRSG
jgi:hypothetical protein